MSWSIALPFAIAALLMTTDYAHAADVPEATVYVTVDEAGTQLREDFNRAKGSVRLVFVVDPVCPMCLRGLDDMNKALLAGTDDPRLQTFVVHVPVLGAEAKDIPWLIYGPEASWDELLPPRPRTLMHQLASLKGSSKFPRLDGDAFARAVRQLLGRPT